MPFKITSKVKGWKALIAVITTLSNEESLFQLREDGIFFKMNSTGNYMMAFFSWKKENHSVYQISEVKDISFKVQDLDKIIGRLDKDSEVTISQDEDKSILTISSGQKEFQMRLLHAPTITIPDKLRLEFTSSFELTIEEIKTALDDVAIVSDFFGLKIENGNLIMRSFRDQFGKYKGIIKSGLAENYENFFSVDFFAGIIKVLAPITDKLTCSFDNYPKPFYMKIDVAEIGVIDYYIAPILKNDGE